MTQVHSNARLFYQNVMWEKNLFVWLCDDTLSHKARQQKDKAKIAPHKMYNSRKDGIKI